MYPVGTDTTVRLRPSTTPSREEIFEIKRPLGLLITRESFLGEMRQLFGTKPPVAFVSATVTPDHQRVRYRNKVNPTQENLRDDVTWKIYTHYKIMDGEMIRARFPE